MIRVANAEIDLFSILMLFLLFKNIYHKNEKLLPDKRLFLYILGSDVLILFFDALQWLANGKVGILMYELNLAATISYYFFHAVPCFCWCLYVRYKVSMNVKETMKDFVFLILPIIFGIVLTVLSLFNGLFYFIDSLNYYHRGKYYWIYVFFILAYFSYAIIYLLANKNKIEKHMYYSLLLFALPPFIGGVIQTFVYGLSLMWPCVALSLLSVYFNIQNNQLYTDHLTGLYNRRLLDIYLERHLKRSRRKSRFGIIMLDINDFKCINDVFSHTTGDKALTETARILKKLLEKMDFWRATEAMNL